jgi:two-component sensor histidine kinase
MSGRGRQVMEIPQNTRIEGSFRPEFWTGTRNADAVKALELAKSGTPAVFQGFADTFAGTPKYWDVRVIPMLDSAGRPERILAVSRDITYLKRIEEEREHLMHELSHRPKNAFSMVQSVIARPRIATTVQEGREILTGRVRALADAQDILGTHIQN